ncbi:ribonuclease J [Holospora curviuscula]|uniref:Putative ribonuclease J n=1 Tax=Holospora curviuscula TaxID=1082868 RepID=A0A2S5RE56_9PROT|nr:ribonuclease J [Holospora curviuscula]PPE05603.1 putative ribonuclease J [Holospora curviuscula]
MLHHEQLAHWGQDVPRLSCLDKIEGLYFLPLGGSDEIGMNLNLYGYGAPDQLTQWIIVDLGVSFSHTPDRVIAPDIRPFLEVTHPEQIKAIVLTHGHEDHIGALPYLHHLLPPLPIYATPFTAFLLQQKALEAKVAMNIQEIPVGGSVEIGPFEIQYVGLTHSIPESNGILVRTPKGSIFHTGDWKISRETMVGGSICERTLRSIGDQNIKAIVCDSTTVFEEGFSGSEVDVSHRLIACVKTLPQGRVVIGCFASNVERLTSCYLAAKASGRVPILAGRSLQRIAKAALHCGYFTPDMHFLEAKDMGNIPPEKQLIIATGSQGEPKAALTAMANGTHHFLSLDEGDHVIFSCRVIPGNEKAVFSLQNSLTAKGINVITSKTAGEIHVSGHPYREELRQMYSWIRPKISIPTHGEARHLREHANFAKSLGVPHSACIGNGMVLRLDEEIPKVVGFISHGKLLVDGKQRLIPENGNEMNERFALLEKGIVFISRHTRKGNRIQIIVSFEGLFERHERKVWSNEIRKRVLQCYGPKPTFDTPEALERYDEGLKPRIENKIRQLFRQRIGKEPIICVHI